MNISNGKLLLQSSDNLWYYSEIIIGQDGFPVHQIEQNSSPSSSVFDSYIVLQCFDNSLFYRFKLYTENSNVYYELIADSPISKNPERLFLKSLTDNIIYEIVATLRDGTIYAEIIAIGSSLPTKTLDLPWKQWSNASEDTSKRKSLFAIVEDTSKRKNLFAIVEDTTKRKNITSVNFKTGVTILVNA